MVSGRNSRLTVELDGDARDLQRTLAASGREINDFARAGGSASQILGQGFAAMQPLVLAGAAAIGTAALAARGLVEDAIGAARSQAVLEGALRASGGAAGVSLVQLEAYADGMMRATGISDEAVKESEAVLLTFRNVTAPIFQETIGLAEDLSVVFKSDLQSSTVQLAKALQDPIEGVTALRRVGVMLTEQQEKQIETFIKAGDVMSAQRVILDEVQSQVGGVARAVGEGSGKVLRLGEAFGELREEAGKAVLEGLDPVIDAALEWAQSDEAVQMARDFGDALTDVAEKAGDVLGALQAIRDSGPYQAVIDILGGEIDAIAVAALAALGGPIGQVAAAWLAGSGVGKAAVGEARPLDWWESLQAAGPESSLLNRLPFGGETPDERARRNAEHLRSEGQLGPEDFEQAAFPSLGLDPTKPVSPTNPRFDAVRAPTPASTPKGAAARTPRTGAAGREPTSFSAESLGLIDQILSGLPGDFGPQALDETAVQQYEDEARRFQIIRDDVNRQLAELGLTMADLDARGLEDTETFAALEERMNALRDASQRIDLIEDLRLTPWKESIDAVSAAIEAQIAAQKQLSDSLFELSKDFLNVKVGAAAQGAFAEFFGPGAGFGPGGEFYNVGGGVSVVVP